MGVAAVLAIIFSLVFLFNKRSPVKISDPEPVPTTRVQPPAGAVVMANSLPGAGSSSGFAGGAAGGGRGGGGRGAANPGTPGPLAGGGQNVGAPRQAGGKGGGSSFQRPPGLQK